MIEKSLSFYRKKAKKLDFKNSNHKKLALLSNFTLQGFSDVLKVISNDHGMNLRIYESPYDQYRQEIINENSEWRKFNPDISFIVLDFESLVGSVLFDYPFFTNEEKNELIEKTCFELTKIVKYALKKKFFYIGALGSKKTHINRCLRLKESGFNDKEIDKIFGPIGIKLGGKSAPEIALSIISQLVSVIYKKI